MIKLAVTVIEKGHYTLKCNAVRTDVVRKRKKNLRIKEELKPCALARYH